MSEWGAVPTSTRSYGTAVALCMVFGVVGVHHFYLGNWLHGMLDFFLLVAALFCIFGAGPTTAAIGVVLLLLDILHTIIVTYLLIVGRCKDGDGALVRYPGQYN